MWRLLPSNKSFNSDSELTDSSEEHQLSAATVSVFEVFSLQSTWDFMCVTSVALKVWICEQTPLCWCLPTFLSDSRLVCLFQIWRLVTATFYFPTGFLYLVNLYFLYHYSSRLETGEPFGLSGFYTHPFSHTLMLIMPILMFVLVFFSRVVWWQTCGLCLHAHL